MPWQRLVADVGGEIDPDTGLPAYREVIVTVPRQSGKTTLVLAWEVQRALGWGRAQRIVYSAQTGNDARKKLIEDQIPILEPRKTKLGISSILKGMGNEAIVWRNGSRLVLQASGAESGHGKTVDLGVKDEFFADVDDRRDQALVPAMMTRADAQVLTTSTMGTDESLPLNRAVERGRAAVTAGQTQGIAYFEWAADPSADADDPETWWSCMPGLGLTVTEHTVRHARDMLTDGEFRRGFLNIATRNDERLIPAITWDMVNRPDVSPSGQVVFAVDVNLERSAAAILAVSGDGEIEVIEHRNGLGWVAPRVNELEERWNRPTWTWDGAKSAPVASLVPDFDVVNRDPVMDMAAASGAFYDAVAEQKVSVRRHPSLDAAVAGAQRKFTSADGWVWSRKGAVDICPLVAATAGLWAANRATEGGQILW